MEKHNLFEKESINIFILVIIILELIGEVTKTTALWMIKPIPIFSMFLYLSFKKPIQDHFFLRMIKIGLLLSLVGDILLMFKSITYFMVGTGFFLIAHVFYCAAFISGKQERIADKITKNKITFGCIFLFLMFISNVYTLWSVMPNQFLFTLYGGILCLMNILSLLRYQKTISESFFQMAIGAFLFGISDNLLALLKFNGIATDWGRGMIMLTYFSGQYLITHGTISHIMRESKKID